MKRAMMIGSLLKKAALGWSAHRAPRLPVTHGPIASSVTFEREMFWLCQTSQRSRSLALRQRETSWR